MELIQIYECLCDATRLRILHLLSHGPLCVCHIQEILKAPQVKISKHLGYLKTKGLVEVRREGYWRVYQLVAKPSKELQANLACLQDCVGEDPVFQKDAEKLLKVRAQMDDRGPVCVPRPKRTIAKR